MPKVVLEVKNLKVAALLASERNARTHSETQITQIAESIREFGFTNPVLVDGHNSIIAGHGRVKAAQVLGLKTVPTICIDYMTETQKRAYILADNKLALNAGWDNDLLALELGDLNTEGYNIGLTGFTKTELKNLTLGNMEQDSETESSINYQEKYAVLVECLDEQEQRLTYDKLCGMGLTCKVLVN